MPVVYLPKGTKNNYTSSIIIDTDRGIVQKTFDYQNLSRELFERELYWLTRLAYSNIVPGILSYDRDTYTITMTWCGEVLNDNNKPDNVYEQLYKISMILLQNGCLYNDWKYGNFLVKDSKITIIDFGWCPRIIEDFTCGSQVNSQTLEKPGGGPLFKDVLKVSND